MMKLRLAGAVATVLLSGTALAQNPKPQAAQSQSSQSGQSLGDPGQSAPKIKMGPRFAEAADITFLTPPDCKEIRRPLESEFLRCINESKRWTFTAGRIELERAIPLKDYREKTNDIRDAEGGILRAGYLSISLQQLVSGSPDTKVLRQPEVLDYGTVRLGRFSARLLVEGKPTLVQQALIQVTDRLYYVLTLRSPSEGEVPEDDPAVLEAAEVFEEISDSIEVLDLKAVREDQDNRLFATRALFYNWNRETVNKALLPEQWLRFVQNGRDIGYAYIVEETANGLPVTQKDEDGNVVRLPDKASDKPAGIRVGVRSRTVGDKGLSVNAESWMFVTYDREHEVWSNLAVTNDPTIVEERNRESWFTEVGASDKQYVRQFDTKPDANGQLALGDDKDPKNIKQVTVEQYKMMVRTESRSAVAPPVDLKPPPFYLPQGFAQVLPRLMPLKEPKGYLFATYLSEQRKVALRYVDVMPEANVTLGGKTVRGIPVVERVGRSGDATTHYLTVDGVYLGSINAGANLQILPTDAATLEKIWKDKLNLTRPDDVKEQPLQETPPAGR